MPTVKDIPLYYIAFNRNEGLESRLRVAGFTDVNHYPAVDGRKFVPKTLLNDDIITFRSYKDLTEGRLESEGLPSLGAVGCTMSHKNVWDICVDRNLPAIIVAEEDMELPEEGLSDWDMENIQDSLSKPAGIFMSTSIRGRGVEGGISLIGTHLYWATRDACVALSNKAYPIDVQTDMYMAHMHGAGKVSVEGYTIGYQPVGRLMSSSIQDVCVTCLFPRGLTPYVITAALSHDNSHSGL